MISIWSLQLLRSARKWLKSERSLFLRKLQMCFKLRKVKITFHSFVSKHFWKELWFCKANMVLPISPVGPTFHCLYFSSDNDFSIRYYRCDRRGRTFSFSIVTKKGAFHNHLRFVFVEEIYLALYITRLSCFCAHWKRVVLFRTELCMETLTRSFVRLVHA